RGLVFGLPQPVCAHRVQQPVRGLLLGGAPTAAVVAFAIGAPALGVDSAALSLRLLGWPLTLVRLCASGLVALAAALLVARATPKLRASASPQRSSGRLGLAPPRAKEAGAAPASAEAPFSARVRDSVVAALGPSLDHVAAWYLVGLVAAAAL